MSNYPRILVLAHGDMWGLSNINRIVPTIRNRYRDAAIEIVLSRHPENIAGTVEPDEIAREFGTNHLKEGFLHRLLDHVDSLPLDKVDKPLLKSFKRVNEYIGNPPEALHHVACGVEGGAEVERITERFRPDIVIDCDALAKLSDKTVAEVPCYHLHPGPMPDCKGDFATARQVIHGKLTGTAERPLLTGSLVRLAPYPQQDRLVINKHVPYDPKESLFALRANIYDALAKTVCWYMPQLLRDAKSTHTPVFIDTATDPVPPLSADDLRQWKEKGNQLQGWYPAIISQNDVMKVMRDVLPPSLRLSSLNEQGLLPSEISYEAVVDFDDKNRCWSNRVTPRRGYIDPDSQRGNGHSLTSFFGL